MPLNSSTVWILNTIRPYGQEIGRINVCQNQTKRTEIHVFIKGSKQRGSGWVRFSSSYSVQIGKSKRLNCQRQVEGND
ncbi:hypothetical protein J6590_033524 [Homalodisca vitripennis]|nr:hypothetical protein J6590_033524 [Homalodisca vitripennis]